MATKPQNTTAGQSHAGHGSDNAGPGDLGGTGFEEDRPASETEAERLHAEAAAPGGVEVDVIDTRVESFISAQMFVPNVQWITQQVVGKGPGTRAQLGRLAGIARSFVRKTNYVQGKELPSVELVGTFEAEIYETGELISANSAYLPKSWANQVVDALESLQGEAGASVKMVISIGVEATGKTIAYRWTINTHLSGAANPELEALKASVLPRLNSRRRQAQLAHEPKTIDGSVTA